MDVRQRKLAKSFRLRLGGFAALTLAAASPAVAETLDSALARAYGANPGAERLACGIARYR